MSECPKGLGHQAPGCELELSSPGHFANTWDTNNETDLVQDGFIITVLISASGGRDTTTVTVDEDMTRDIHTRGLRDIRDET